MGPSHRARLPEGRRAASRHRRNDIAREAEAVRAGPPSGPSASPSRDARLEFLEPVRAIDDLRLGGILPFMDHQDPLAVAADVVRRRVEERTVSEEAPGEQEAGTFCVELDGVRYRGGH